MIWLLSSLHHLLLPCAASPTAASSATAAGAVAANTDESGAEYNVNKRCEIADNYNGHDTDEQQGGAALHSIVAQCKPREKSTSWLKSMYPTLTYQRPDGQQRLSFVSGLR